MLAVAGLVLLASPARGRGLLPAEPPWHRPTLADTVLGLEFSFATTTGDTTGTVLGAALAPVRRGPVGLGFAWQFVSVRTANGREFGFGDPQVFARMRLLGQPAGAGARLHVEGAARIPSASTDLYPYAAGGQEIELHGTLQLGSVPAFLVTAGWAWNEAPPGLESTDMPDGLHVGCALAHGSGDWVLRARGDVWWMSGGRERGQIEAGFARRARRAIRPSLGICVGLGPGAERTHDIALVLRFATPVRGTALGEAAPSGPGAPQASIPGLAAPASGPWHGP